MGVNRRTLILGGILVAVIIGAIVFRSADTQPPTPARPRPQAPARGGAAAADTTPADVNLVALDRERTEPEDLGRNPFRFKPKPPPPAPPAPPTRPFKPADGQTDGPGGVSNVPAGPPPPPPITLKFIGVVQKTDGVKIAVLTDGKRPINGKEGDELEGRYKILRIGDESIDIAYIDGRGRRTIALTGK